MTTDSDIKLERQQVRAAETYKEIDSNRRKKEGEKEKKKEQKRVTIYKA